MPQKHNWSLRLFSSQNLSLPLAVCVCLCVHACGCWCGCWCVCIHMCDYYICLINLPLDQICPAKLQRCTLGQKAMHAKKCSLWRGIPCSDCFVNSNQLIHTKLLLILRTGCWACVLVGISWNYNQLELRKQWNACSSKKAALSSVHEYT